MNKFWYLFLQCNRLWCHLVARYPTTKKSPPCVTYKWYKYNYIWSQRALSIMAHLCSREREHAPQYLFHISNNNILHGHVASNVLDGQYTKKSWGARLSQENKNGIVWNFYYTPCFNEAERGLYTGFTLSVCGQNQVPSVSSIILVGSISYLHILSKNNFRICVAVGKVCFEIGNFG